MGEALHVIRDRVVEFFLTDLLIAKPVDLLVHQSGGIRASVALALQVAAEGRGPVGALPELTADAVGQPLSRAHLGGQPRLKTGPPEYAIHRP